jgi:hypothetical protein
MDVDFKISIQLILWKSGKIYWCNTYKSKDLSYYSIIFIPPSADKTNDSIAEIGYKMELMKNL